MSKNSKVTEQLQTVYTPPPPRGSSLACSQILSPWQEDIVDSVIRVVFISPDRD